MKLKNPSMSKDSSVKDSLPKRQQWKGKWQFIFASMSYAIGLGTLWRFPFLLYKHGGVSFLVPYITMVILVGLPLWILEVGVGQLHQSGVITSWARISPQLKGLGIAMATIAFICNTYYIVVLTWAIHYWVHTVPSPFSLHMPWTICDNWWNTDNCETLVVSRYEPYRIGGNSSAVEFWNRQTLQKTSSIAEFGGIQPSLAFGLFFAWLQVFFCLRRGVKSLRYVVPYLALVPCALIGIFLVVALSQSGAIVSVIRYSLRDASWSKVFEPQAWWDATVQVVFTYGLSLGAMTAIGSHNAPGTNSYRKLFYVSAIHTATCLLASAIVFGFLSFFSFQSSVHISKIPFSGPGLLFITIPQTLSLIRCSHALTFLFFLLCLFLGFGSQIFTVHGFVTALVDCYPRVFARKQRKALLVAGVCAVSFLIGLTMVSGGGIYVFNLLDTYGTSDLLVYFFALLQCLVIGWLYKADQFSADLEQVAGFKVARFFHICWKYMTPLVIAIVAGRRMVTFKYFSNRVEYPEWSNSLGLLLFLAILFIVPYSMAFWHLKRLVKKSADQKLINA